MEQSPYQPPNAELGQETDTGLVDGSLETALTGDYDASIGTIVGDSWRLTKGNKGAVWLAMIGAGVIYAVADWFTRWLGVPDGAAAIAAGDYLQGYGVSLLKGFILLPVTAPLFAGAYMMVIRRIGGEAVGPREITGYFKYLPTLIPISIMASVFTYVGIALLIVPGIYLSVAYAFAIPLMLDKQLSPWASMEASRKAVTRHWFSIFGVAIVVYLLAVLLCITLIGIVWAVPMMLVTYAVLYRRIFGFENTESASQPIVAAGAGAV